MILTYTYTYRQKPIKVKIPRIIMSKKPSTSVRLVRIESRVPGGLPLGDPRWSCRPVIQHDRETSMPSIRFMAVIRIGPLHVACGLHAWQDVFKRPRL